MLHTQTFCAFEAAVLGSWRTKPTSDNPLIRARAGTEAVMTTVPVEVAPRVPGVAAWAAVLAIAATMTAALSEAFRTVGPINFFDARNISRSFLRIC